MLDELFNGMKDGMFGDVFKKTPIPPRKDMAFADLVAIMNHNADIIDAKTERK